jgi:alpha-amylase/alpha-mannosidase (GH57 family)
MTKAEGFTVEDRKLLIELIGGQIATVIPRYRKLAETGQIELSATPHFHPLAPLLIDFASAREAMPGVPLPKAPHYPKGRLRVTEHVRLARSSHRERFGAEPIGMWPAEGSISNETLEVMAAEGCRWAASGEGVLVNSLHKTGKAVPSRDEYLYRPYRLAKKGEGLQCFFRDDHLSDLIGFEYSRWHGKDAATHFVDQIEGIAQRAVEGETPVISVILDGENAWEYYPYNGFYFLDELYTALEASSLISTTTYADYLKQGEVPDATGLAIPHDLDGITAGSWVYGNFSTWIGSPDKNRAWDLLCAAKQGFDMVMSSGRLSQAEQEAAEVQLRSCESSDWFCLF